MKNYTYNGLQASVSIRTIAGVLMLQRNITTSVSKELDHAASNHPVTQALIKTGELTITGKFAPEQADNPLVGHTETDAVAAAEATKKADANATDETTHSVIDPPVTTQLTITTPATSDNGQPAADQASNTDAPAAEHSPENVTNADAPKPPTIPQLKKQLDEAGIKYEANAKRDELVALLPK